MNDEQFVIDQDQFVITIETPNNVKLRQWYGKKTLGMTQAFNIMFNKVVGDAVRIDSMVADKVIEEGITPEDALNKVLEEMKNESNQ